MPESELYRIIQRTFTEGTPSETSNNNNDNINNQNLT